MQKDTKPVEKPVETQPHANEVGESEDGSHKLIDFGLGKGKRMVIKPTPPVGEPYYG
jgi:hypothetical protein